MRKYAVRVPIVGYAYYEVTAPSKEDAIEEVFQQGLTDYHISELDMYENIDNGDADLIPYRKVDVEEIY
jgi:hypothetical protein